LSTTFAFVGFQENIQQFIPQMKTSLKSKGLVVLLAIIFNDNVYCRVKRKLDFDESKLIYEQKPSQTLSC
jgi:hypothetical protein